MGISGLNTATGFAPTKQAYNVIISNVPGPQKQLYYEGSAVEGLYPVSIVLDGQALNITLQSYADKLEFGLIACRRTVPRMQRLLKLLELGLQELEPAGRKEEDEEETIQVQPKAKRVPKATKPKVTKAVKAKKASAKKAAAAKG
jgi:hypothetical protein